MLPPTRSPVAALFVGAALFALAGSSTAQEKKPLNESFSGNIEANDPLDTVRRQPCKIHKVKLQEGRPYLVELRSPDFDTYLRIEDSNGNQVAEDDDGGGKKFTDSKLRWTAPKTDEYRLIATSFLGGVGAYTLEIRDGNLPVAKKGGGGAPAKTQKIDAPAEGKPVVVESELTPDDPVDPTRNLPGKAFEVELAAGSAYQIDMASNRFDCYLRLLDPAGKQVAHDDDGGEMTNSRIRYTPTAAGKYTIVATQFKKGLGAFHLTVKVGDKVDLGRKVAYDPKKVHDVEKGFHVADRLLDGDPRDAVKSNSPSRVHLVKLEEGKTYVIDLQGQADPYLRVETAEKQILAADDDGGEGLNSRLEFRPKETATYRIVATNLEGVAGDYTLIVREKR